jgi:hypothetical protein
VLALLLVVAPAVSDASTVRDLVAAAETAATSANLPAQNAAAASALAMALDTLRASRVLDEDLEVFVTRYVSPDAIARARRRQSRYTADMKQAIDTIKAMANVVLPAVGAPSAGLDALVLELAVAEQTVGLAWDRETLRRLARKYGPGSARLNGAEVLLAYALQRVPGFGIVSSGAQKGRPGPLEAVLAYAPTYITRSDAQMRAIGVVEAGVRHYFFRDGWGDGSGALSFLRPAYASYGVAWTSGSDAALRPPWEHGTRLGAFVGWGALKVAWVGGDQQRLSVTQQYQLIPWVF